MYPSRGNNAYGQQQQQQTYSGQSAYGQHLGSEGAASQMLSGYPSAGTNYGGQYASVYGGSAALSSALEAPVASARESGASVDYSVLSQQYVPKHPSDYTPGDRIQYIERAGVYTAQDLQNQPTARFGDSVAFGHHEHQGGIYSAASALRKELQQGQTHLSSPIEGSSTSRQSDYLPRAATIRQEHLPYNGRMNDDLSHRPSILGAAPAPRRDTDDLLVYSHTASGTSGYGVSLPPGRDYGSAKGLHSTPHSQGGGYARVDDDRVVDRRAEVLRRDVLREREKERERKRERERDNKRVFTDKKRERTPPPRTESSSHRRRSPAKEKRRDYVCKVNSSSLVDVERDYMSLDKRYPRLFTSPECSKVIVNWSRENLQIPLNVPVSFEHDFVKDDTETQNKESTIVNDPVKSENTRWNAKIVLMSGLSQNALEELSSERDYEDRIPHFCNMIRFACLKDGHTLKAIGGLWETTDGNDPSVDKSTLVHTALRHAKDLTGLDLNNCQHWNPFLEIHYDRVRKDGVFSHKEVTLLYVPDLSDCLPSVDAWRDQWLKHKKAISEKERERALKREISRGKKEGSKDKEPGTPKDVKKDAKSENKKTSGSDESASKLKETGKDKVKEPEKETNAVVIEKKSGVETPGEGNNTVEKKAGSGKKKIIRKVIKKKVVKKDKAGNTPKQSDTLDSKKVGEATTETQSQGQGQGQSQGQQESTVNTPVVKTITKKKVIKKVPVKKAVKKKDEGTQSEVTPVKEQESSENKAKNAADTGSASVKKTVKKKIIKRVMKRKVVAKDANKDKVIDKPQVTTIEEEKKDENENKGEKNCVNEEKIGSGSSKKKGIDGNNEKLKTDKLKEGKVKKEKDDAKGETKGKEVKDNKKDEEVPRHPGLFLQTKETNKFRSYSFSLDSLLDYDDNDIEESTFELSLFAETFYEMLQYQMGSRILSFLQKLRMKFVAKRNQKKRQLEEKEEKVKTSKRLKTDDSESQTKSTDDETMEEDEKIIPKVESSMVTENIEETKSDEDPEEDDEDMTGGSPKDDTDVKPKNIVKKEEEEKVDIIKKKENIDKELLQAFRFFDRNRVGHIRVEDMRLIIHNLGNFLSHREVKELVQSALLESNTGRDHRILYNKLVRMSDII